MVSSSTMRGKTALAGLATTATVAAFVLVLRNAAIQRSENRRKQRSKLVEIEKEKDVEEEEETLPSILEHFRELHLEQGCTVEEANKRRTTKYYELARDAHLYDLVVGIRSYVRLRNRRENEMARIMKYWKWNNTNPESKMKSHRTVIVMVDEYTQRILHQARQEILEPLNWTHDITTGSRVWIPEQNCIPQQDMHVTIAVPWWWHTVRPGNRALSDELVARFRQALIHEFHHPFQLELERIVLLGGKALVALWRCVGERTTEDGDKIHDRHGEKPDPLVKLRGDIVGCFTASDEFEAVGKEPLTYAHRFQQVQDPNASFEGNPPVNTSSSLRDFMKRENSIEMKTPGLSGRDGFIHTTLARLPLNCLSMHDVELAPIHRLCREATATYCGHRLVVNKFRFLETMGAGGESNPCVDPIFDETIAAPLRFEVDEDGAIGVNTAFSKNVERHVTIGAPPTNVERRTVDDLFPVSIQEIKESNAVSGRNICQ